MYGNIDRLSKNDRGSTTYGFIFGEDGNQYFFHKSSLINCTIYQIEEGDSVEFDPQPSVPLKRSSAINVRKRSSSSSSSEISSVNPGMNPNIHLDHFNSEEKKIVDSLSKTLYVTNGGNTVYINECMYKYILIKPTTNFSTLFRLTREIVVIFSDYVNFEHRSLDVATEVFSSVPSTLRLDRGCHILISNDTNVEQKIYDLFKDTNHNSIVIPFSYQEFLSDQMHDQQIMDRFRKYLFDADLFSTSNPIENDLFFFGRRDYVQDISSKCKCGSHCGVFGLRRSGKTSLLLAVQRKLKAEGYTVVYIPSQKDLATQNWKSALHVIAKNVQLSLGYDTSVLHKEDEYKKNSANIFFEEDMNLMLAEMSRPIVLMFDEVEYITFNVPESEPSWRKGNSFVQFWNVLKGYYTKYHARISIVVAGTNPMINEEPTIPILNDNLGSDETRVPNPMFGQLSTSNQGAYLPPFDIESTKVMINTLGGYMGIQFNDSIAAALTSDCGGHPYLIRLLCGYINRFTRNQGLNRPIDISKGIYEKARAEFEKGIDAEGFYLMILHILQSSYIKEYNTLKILATEGDAHIIQMLDSTALQHLLGYGLIEDNAGNYAIRFDTIKRFLNKTYQFERENLSIEDQKQEINVRFDAAEQQLRSIIRDTLRTSLGKSSAKQAVITVMQSTKSTQGYFATKAEQLEYKQLFDPTVNGGCFFTILIELIANNFTLFSNVFETDLSTVRSNLTTLNRARRLPSHSAPENAEKWTTEDFKEFRSAMKWLEDILSNYD